MIQAKFRNFCFKNFKRNSYPFRAGRLVEEGTLYRGPFDGGYISFYEVLNLVLTLFCQGNEEEIHDFEIVGGKAKNNRIPIMLAGRARPRRKDFADETSFRITIKSLRHAHARGIITTNEQQDKRKGINKNSQSRIKLRTRRKTASLLVLLYSLVLADIVIYKSGIITVVMRRTLDHISNLRLILFPDGLMHFLISKYASPALMFFVKT